MTTETTSCKHPEIDVQLSGTDGNAFALMGQVTKALKRAGHGDEVDAFRAEAMSGDYAHLLQTCAAWVNVS